MLYFFAFVTLIKFYLAIAASLSDILDGKQFVKPGIRPQLTTLFQKIHGYPCRKQLKSIDIL